MDQIKSTYKDKMRNIFHQSQNDIASMSSNQEPMKKMTKGMYLKLALLWYHQHLNKKKQIQQEEQSTYKLKRKINLKFNQKDT